MIIDSIRISSNNIKINEKENKNVGKTLKVTTGTLNINKLKE
ncbi:hypothetical protein J6TS2_33710 [Heyndrickxia sporothermodurans]|nr:hypothetical protein J6TS2_33710 [Heyndrickxia sporothermodurans]